MTAAATRTFPGPRTYQSWLRDLSALHPRRLWFSHLLVHRLEALVVIARPTRLDTLSRGLLSRLFSSATPATVPALDDLHLDRQFALPLLHELAAASLVRPENGGWALTESGRHALDDGAYTHRSEERRVFYFVDPADAQESPRYLPLAQTGGALSDVAPSWSFAPSVLEECLQRPREWKEQVRFPTEVERAIVAPAAGWRGVLLDRAEHAPLLFVETATSLLGFLARLDNGTLQREPPALAVNEGWRELLPDFAESLDVAAWRKAWLAWCENRQLPPNEAAACAVEYADCKVHVKAVKGLVDRLKMARSELMRGETWLTLGTGRTRAVASVEIHDQ